MQLLSKYNKGFRFLLCVIDILSKYAWVIPLKDKKGISIRHKALVKLKILYHGHMFLIILIVKRLLVLFMKKNYKALSKINLG